MIRPPFKPPLGSRLIRGHPLARGLVSAWLMNQGVGGYVYDLMGRRPGALASSAWQQSKRGTVIQHDATGDRTTLLTTDERLPTLEVTVVIGYEKTDSTNRASGLFGISSEGAASQKCGVHGPYSDGTMYWDFGGLTGGTSRLSVAGLTVSGFNIWGFTAGKSGMQIFQNGVLRATQTGNATRTTSGTAWKLGEHGGEVSDLVNYSFVYLFDRQLKAQEQAWIARDPYAMVYSKRPPIYFPSSSGAALLRRITSRAA